MDWWKRPIIVPISDFEKDAVRHAQRVLGAKVTGEMDDETKAVLRGVQALFKLPLTGILDKATAEQIQKMFPEGA